jgi:hypothetical protein
MNQMMFAGFVMVITSLPIGMILSLQVHFKEHWDWTWTGILAVVTTLAIAIVGCLLDLGGALIARWWWGVSLTEISCGSQSKPPDSN